MDNGFNALKSWGIHVPDEYDSALEYLMQNYPDNMFYIDSCPYTVSSNEKYGQFEVFYQQVLQGKLSKKSFLELEIKYLNVIIELWLYNKINVEFNSDWLWIRNKRRIVDKKYRKQLKDLIHKVKTTNIIEVTDRLELELIVQLGIRDVVSTTFYIENYEILIDPSWSCFIVYFKNIDLKEVVKDIVMTEGLYLRPGKISLRE